MVACERVLIAMKKQQDEVQTKYRAHSDKLAEELIASDCS